MPVLKLLLRCSFQSTEDQVYSPPSVHNI